MQWENDLIKDIKYNTDWDDKDGDPRIPFKGWDEVTEADREALKERFLRVSENCSAILEIGVNRNGDGSFTQVFLKNKKRETIYIGIDIGDRDYLINEEENIFIIRADSSHYEENIKKIDECFEKCGVSRKEFDFIFIDGWHSINQCLKDWEYTSILGKNGIVGLHDTAYHPGPKVFIRNLNKDKWVVEENAIQTSDDWGIGFAWKKENNNWSPVEEGYEWKIDPPNME
jgi:hypothetical protein